MTIGEALAQARNQAGLTVAEVSERTRIRPALIREIEQDDYGECGGDFYARGHIRAIADAVGADPGPLIQEYDAAHPAVGKQLTVADLYKPASPFVKRERRGAARAAALAVVLLAVIGVASYELVSGVGQTQRAAATAKTGPGTASGPHHTAPRSHAVAAPRHTTSSPTARATTAPTPTVTAHPAAPVQVLVPAAAAAFGPGGTADGDDSSQAVYAIDSDPTTFWHTSWYTTAEFGNLKTGTGLLVDLGSTVTVTSVDVTLGSTPGAGFQVRAGDTPSPASLPRVASASGAGGTTHVQLASGVHARYVLLWFTTLPPDAAGTYQVNVYNVSVTGRPLCNPPPARFGHPHTQHRLATAHAPVLAIPWPVATIVRVHDLQGMDLSPVQVDGRVQVGVRNGDLYDLDQRSAAQSHLLTRVRRFRVEDMGRDVVEQAGRPVDRHSRDDKLRPPMRRQTDRVRPRRVYPVPLDSLHGPPVLRDEPAHVVEEVVRCSGGVVALPAHMSSCESAAIPSFATMLEGTDIPGQSPLTPVTPVGPGPVASLGRAARGCAPPPPYGEPRYCSR